MSAIADEANKWREIYTKVNSERLGSIKFQTTGSRTDYFKPQFSADWAISQVI